MIQQFFVEGNFGGVVQGNNLSLPSAFQCLSFVPLVGQKIGQRGQKKRTELAFLFVHLFQGFLFEQKSKKGLRQIFCLVRVGSSSSIAVRASPGRGTTPPGSSRSRHAW